MQAVAKCMFFQFLIVTLNLVCFGVISGKSGPGLRMTKSLFVGQRALGDVHGKNRALGVRFYGVKFQ